MVLLKMLSNAASQGRGKPHKLRLEGSSPSAATKHELKHTPSK